MDTGSGKIETVVEVKKKVTFTEYFKQHWASFKKSLIIGSATFLGYILTDLHSLDLNSITTVEVAKGIIVMALGRALFNLLRDLATQYMAKKALTALKNNTDGTTK